MRAAATIERLRHASRLVDGVRVAIHDGEAECGRKAVTELVDQLDEAHAELAVALADLGTSRIGAGDNPRSTDLVPETIRRSLLRYANEGTPVGGFLEAVLTGDLFRACRNADGVNVRAIPAIAAYVDSELPGGAYGSPKAYGEWIEMHAEILEGRRCSECWEPLDKHVLDGPLGVGGCEVRR